MKNNSILSKIILLPCSKLYGAATFMRNKFFDWHILKEVEFDIPVIAVGNLAVGGTGKTPHVEYIVDKMRRNRKVAVLSRGYKRETHGFVMAGRNSMPRDIGDESYQIYRKFGGEVIVAVCEDRVHGIRELLRTNPSIEMIVLDDAFQHRYVKPTVSVVVSEYNRPVYRDSLLPYGNLREGRRGLNRAEILIVSKCPTNMRPFDYSDVRGNYDLMPFQHLFFSHFQYKELRPVFPELATTVPYLDWLGENDRILAIAGIGNPRPFIRQVKSHGARVKVDIYPDHHNYTRKDIEYIQGRFDSLRKGGQRIIVTTEKDAVRLKANPYFPYELKASTFYLPISVEFDRPDNEPGIIEVLRKIIDGNHPRKEH